MTNSIHSTAVIDPSAEIAEDVVIGPFCVIGAHVKIGRGCKLHSHVVMDAHIEMGEGNEIFPFVSMMKPQDLKYKGEPTQIKIGNNNTIREYVTINPGTPGDKELTQIGDNNLLMIGVHVAHDCVVGNNNVLANNVTLAGHVKIGSYCVLGGLSAFHQFVQVGDYAIVGGMSPVEHDVIPYGLVKGERAKLAGLNHIGLDRRGFDKADIKALMSAYKLIFAGENGTFKDRMAQAIEIYKDNHIVNHMIEFIQSDRDQPLCQPK
jgi:UDP-N-acetylglucosamine acyltransferase